MRIFSIAVTASVLVFSQAASAEQVWLRMDQVRPYALEKDAGQIVIGNPGIADVKVQDKTKILLFGKTPGATNIYVFDEEGNPVKDLKIRVESSGQDMLTMHRGVARTTYNCMTSCEPTITVGDENTGFQNTVAQAQTKFDQAASSNR